MLSRLKDIRKNDLQMTQHDFAKAIGVSQNNYSKIESGKRSLSDKHIKLLCYEYHISECWLRTGEGPKFYNGLDEAELVRIFHRLLPSNRKLVIDIARKILKAQKEDEA